MAAVTKDELAAAVTKDMHESVRLMTEKAARLEALMDAKPTDPDWDVWARKEERLRRQIDRFRTAIDRRKG